MINKSPVLVYVIFHLVLSCVITMSGAHDSELQTKSTISNEVEVAREDLDKLHLYDELGEATGFEKSEITKYLHQEFVEKRKSFLDISWPNNPQKKFAIDEIRQFGDKATLSRLDVLLNTIPQDPQDPNLSIKDFSYQYDDKGVLRNTETGEKFQWINQLHYDLLGDVIVPYIQDLMVKQYGMQELWIPEDPNIPVRMKNNIFLTKDALANPDKLMLLIQGSGAVRPGQWARALCINDCLDKGTILPYLEKATKSGYGIIVLNPNQNFASVDGPVRPLREAFFKSGKQASKTVNMKPIPMNESPLSHTLYVWDQYASKAAAKDIVIVAHSAGGLCTATLLNKRGMQVFDCGSTTLLLAKLLLPKLRAVAFTDSIHNPKDLSRTSQEFLREYGINWVTSDKPLDTLIQSPTNDCKRVSAGHTKHEYTSASAIDSVFRFLHESHAVQAKES